MDWLKCNICFNSYNDLSQRPRSLTCGHTFCERCLSNTIINERLTCPQCRKIHEINSVIVLPINFVVEGLLKSLNICSQDVSEGAVSRPIEEESNLDDNNDSNDSLKSLLVQQEKSLSSQKELLKASAGMCIEHTNNELIFRCYSHKSWVCEQCIEEQGDHPKHKCIITYFKEEIEDRKSEHKRSLDNEGKLCDETLSIIERHMSYLSDRKDHHVTLVDTLQDLVNMHKKEEENLQDEIQSFERKIENGKTIKQSLLDFEETNLNASTLNESNAVRDLVKTKNAEARNWINTCQKEVDECKLKVEGSSHLVMTSNASKEYTEKCGLLQKELDKNINKVEVIEETDKRTDSRYELTEKNKSRESGAANNDDCNDHGKSIGHWCFKCLTFICEDCLECHSTLVGCSTTTSTKAIGSMKDKHIKDADTLLIIFEGDVKYLSSKIQEFANKRKELLEKADKFQEDAKKLKKLFEPGNTLKELLVESKNHLKEANSPYAVTDNIKVLTQRTNLLLSWSIKNLGTDTPLGLLKALKEKKTVYAESVIGDFTRFAKLSLHKENILIHSFLIQEVANGSICMSFNRLQKMIDDASLIFLDLKQCSGYSGCILIRLDKNLPKTRRCIVNLATGSEGKTLSGIEFNQEYTGLDVGAGILPYRGTKFSSESSKRKAKRGDLIGRFMYGYLSNIYIYLGKAPNIGNYNKDLCCVIGNIEEGLVFIEKLYSYWKLNSKTPGSDTGIKVNDCGLVLEQE